MHYLFWLLLALILSTLFTIAIKKLALRYKILDFPNLASRKIHQTPTPLLGGISVYLAFSVVLTLFLFFEQINYSIVPIKFFLAIMSGGLILCIGGFLDDKYNLPPKISWIFPAFASLIIVFSGIGVGIKYISNPFGEPIFIGQSFSLFTFHFSLSALLVWLWLMGMIYTTKLLDGLDGLATGIGSIGAFTMFLLSLTEKVNQPITASIAIILTGCFLGFLIFNFNPASVFLGEAGSTFIGFSLGVISIILGAKIATALLVMGIPILDVAWVIVKRIFYKSSPFSGDRSHLHFKLLDIGLSQKQAVLLLFTISAFFGFTAVFLQSLGKLIALVFLFSLMIILAIGIVAMYKRKHPHLPDLFDSIDEKTKK